MYTHMTEPVHARPTTVEGGIHGVPPQENSGADCSQRPTHAHRLSRPRVSALGPRAARPATADANADADADADARARFLPPGRSAPARDGEHLPARVVQLAPLDAVLGR